MKTPKYPYYRIDIPLFPANIKLCFSDEAFREILKDANVTQKLVSLDSGIAETHHITDNKQSLIILIFDLKECYQDGNEFHLLSTVCHEATHATQRVFDSIGEEDPGEEIRAYITEFIFTQTLKGIKMYVDSGKGHRKTPDETSQKILRSLLQMVELGDRSTGQNSLPKPKDVSSGVEDGKGSIESKAKDSVRPARRSGLSGSRSKK